MKVNELRIGNLVRKNGILFPVSEIHANGRLFYEGTNPDGITARVEITNPEPIPLDLEILEKAGFDKSGMYWVNSQVYVYELGIIDVEYVYNYNYTFIALKSLHQLQNLYFSLVGSELPITL